MLLRRWLVLCLLLAGKVCFAQTEIQLDDLTEDEYAALEEASEASVRGTISFLASDELAGRGTPSPELNIATAYVASRFRAAGLTGLGSDGSYFLQTSLETLQTPKQAQLTSSSGTAVGNALFEGGSDVFEFKGKPARVTTATLPPTGYVGPVISSLAIASSDRQPPALQLRREARRLSAAGATALIIEAPADSPLWDLAEQRQQYPRLDSARSSYELPILLVAPEQLDNQSEVHLNIPPNVRTQAEVRNVVGVRRGSDAELAEQAIVFSAHLDHLGRGAPGPDPIYNGADDDASGVTAVLTLADVFGKLAEAPKRSVIFVTFWGEERGLLGSKEFVANSPWPLEQISANVNIEMIGRPEEGANNKCWMTGWQASNLGALMAQGSRRLGVEMFEHPSYSARLYRASDNYSFVQRGVIAHSFSAGSLHEDYHQPSDEWEKLNLPHMTQVIRGIYAGVLPIAQGELTPQASE